MENSNKILNTASVKSTTQIRANTMESGLEGTKKVKGCIFMQIRMYIQGNG